MVELILAVIGGFALVASGGWIGIALVSAWFFSAAMSGPKRKRRRWH